MGQSPALARDVARVTRDWPQWRGPGGLGVSIEKGLPTQWNPTNNILWKVPIAGHGHSSPVITGDRVFLTSSVEGEIVSGAKAVKHKLAGEDFKHPESVGADRKHTFTVICVDRRTGKIQWEKTAYTGTVFDDRHRQGSFAAPTPATDGRHVYAFFGGEGLYCYTFSGYMVWKQQFGGLATLGLGPGTSPVLSQKLVIVQCDQDNGENSFIAAYDKNSGKERWRIPRNVSASWATPIIVNAGARSILIASGNQAVIAYDTANGKELWRGPGLEANAVPSPVAGHGLAFVSAGYPVKRTLALDVSALINSGNTNAVVWRYDKGAAYVPSPILYGDYLYLMTDSGLMSCLEARTGKVEYEGARLPMPARFTASPVGFDNKLFLTSDKGETFVIRAGPTHVVLATNSVGEAVFASPAVSRGQIFIRGEKHLFCIGQPGGR